MEKANLDHMQVVEVSLNDLVDEANQAMDRMGKDNPHRKTVHRLASALVALADRFSQLGEERNKLLAELEFFKEDSGGKKITLV